MVITAALITSEQIQQHFQNNILFIYYKYKSYKNNCMHSLFLLHNCIVRGEGNEEHIALLSIPAGEVQWKMLTSPIQDKHKLKLKCKIKDVQLFLTHMRIKRVVYVLAEVGHRAAAPVLKHVQVGPSLVLQEKQRERGCPERNYAACAAKQPLASDASQNQTHTSCCLSVKAAVSDSQYITVHISQIYWPICQI